MKKQVKLFLLAGWGICCARHLRQQAQLYMAVSAENVVLKQQNEYYRTREEEFEQKWLMLRRMRHDMANNRILEMDYLENGEYELLMEHYREQTDKIKTPGGAVYTGNIGVDSIVNYKLEAARKLKITVERTIEIAGEVRIKNIDINILVGNLMDNAIEAVRDMALDKRRITLLLRTDKTAFFLEISNPFQGKIRRNREGELLTCKEDKVNHGLGLKEAKEIARKYGGQLMVHTDKNEFRVKVLLYMNGA